MTDKLIKNEQWYIKTLASKVLNGEIYKPKYQRKRKWVILPKKEDNVPSERNYIEFLYGTYNSVHPITFGQDGDKLSNIDGNNRINAIMHYLKEPFILFPEKIDELKKFIAEKISIDIACELENIVKKMSYDELMFFRYNKYFTNKGFEKLYNDNLKLIRDEVEPIFDELINKMKINGKDSFDANVTINVNIFIGYTTEELAEVFGKINKYNSGLTEQEALASRLFNNSNFIINDKLLEYEIKQKLKIYYDNRTTNEILDCYTYSETNDVMNAYDFMVGFQNYSNEKCKLIHKTDNDGLFLYFKIYKDIYKGTFDITITTENINNFIEYIKKSINILQKLNEIIFMENLVSGTNKLFDTANKKLNSLTKNNLLLIISAIIGYIKNDIPENDILKSIQKCVLFHYFVDSIIDKEQRDEYKKYDGILYEAGGKFMDNKAKEYLKYPNLISCKITKDIMENVLNKLINENIKNREYTTRTNGRDTNDKRRNRKSHEKILIYYYYVCNVPNHFLKNNFWVEHIFPFSCSWENQIDIDRLGNIFPILETLNKERSNKHINVYEKLDKEKFLSFIGIIPSIKMYDEIVSHVDTNTIGKQHNKKPHVINSEKYNDFCSNNEKILINCFLKKIF